MVIRSRAKRTTCWQFWLFISLCFLLLFGSYHWNFFQIEKAQREQNLSVDAQTLLPALQMYAGGPWLLRDLGEMQLESDGEGNHTTYYMQVGLQRQFYSWISPDNQAGVTEAIPRLRTLIEALLALTLAAFLAVACAEFGYVAAGVAAVLLALSNWLVVFAPDLYWACATFFLPFVIAWLFGDPARTRNQRRLLAVIFTLLCLIKCLCGYEYLTNIFAAVAIPFLYYGLRRGNSPRTILARVLRYGALSIAAFLFALLLQLIQFAFVQKDLRGGIDGFLHEAKMRTAISGEGISSRYDLVVLSGLHRLHVPQSNDAKIESLLSPMRPALRYLRYLTMGAVTVPLPFRALKLPIGLFVAGFAAYFWFRRRQLWRAVTMIETGRIDAWMWSTLLALFISHLWALLANGHMTHTFFNAIIFYIPFLPMVFVAIGIAFASSISPSKVDL